MMESAVVSDAWGMHDYVARMGVVGNVVGA